MHRLLIGFVIGIPFLFPQSVEVNKSKEKPQAKVPITSTELKILKKQVQTLSDFSQTAKAVNNLELKLNIFGRKEK
tara:strand:- start:195 stop:422 length:228 start_codon:yes stop_codon:yes gene_type:complete